MAYLESSPSDDELESETFVFHDGNKLTMDIAKQFRGALLTSIEAAGICNTFVPQDVPPHMSPHAV